MPVSVHAGVPLTATGDVVETKILDLEASLVVQFTVVLVVPILVTEIAEMIGAVVSTTGGVELPIPGTFTQF